MTGGRRKEMYRNDRHEGQTGRDGGSCLSACLSLSAGGPALAAGRQVGR